MGLSRSLHRVCPKPRASVCDASNVMVLHLGDIIASPFGPAGGRIFPHWLAVLQWGSAPQKWGFPHSQWGSGNLMPQRPEISSGWGRALRLLRRVCGAGNYFNYPKKKERKIHQNITTMAANLQISISKRFADI